MNFISSLFLAKSELVSLLTVVAFVMISLLNSWIQKQKTKSEIDRRLTTDDPPPLSPAPRAPESMEDWQEELRRLLKPEPPPLPNPAPLRREAAPPRTFFPPAEVSEGPAMEMPPLVESKTAMERATEINEQVTARLRQVSSGLGHSLARGDEAVEQAARLEALAQEQIRAGIARSASSSGTRPAVARSPEADAVLDLFTRPAGLRQAVLASLILAPPKGLEPH